MKILFDNLLAKSIITAPIPYIGQNGPYRKPLFTGFLTIIVLYMDSKPHPKNEYIIK